uniref:Transposon Ty3-I Gag-Pol polyprotein n=1 Tax=Cajanus cajan TaxID=3821 RepID=A0A151TRJ6_CAJCA|nr:Transposon Ty3-I Gag-Pol polyprotein [Cajanus cajan]
MLAGEIVYWWRGTRQMIESRGVVVDWDCFKRVFLENYLSDIVRYAKEAEFMRLQQGSMFVLDYAMRFEHLARFYSQAVSETWRCRKIEGDCLVPRGQLVLSLVLMEIPEWKCDSVTKDFVVGLPRTARNSDSIWMIVDRLIKCAHFLPVKRWSLERLAQLYIREIVRLHGVPSSIIFDRDPRFTSRKVLADRRRRPLEFEEGEHVFHVSQLRKYIRDPSQVVEIDEVQVRENLTYEKRPVAVVDHKLKKLRGKSISLVKILWDASTGEATWEVESKFKEQYPFLFSGKPIFGDENSCLLGGTVT